MTLDYLTSETCQYGFQRLDRGGLVLKSVNKATHILGFPVPRHSGFAGPLLTIGEIIAGLTAGLVTWSSVIISAISIPILYAGKMAQIKYKEKLKGFPIPTELALVAVTTVIFYFYEADVKIVGEVPGGLPTFTVPKFSLLQTIGKVQIKSLFTGKL